MSPSGQPVADDAVVSLGSNLGDSRELMELALQRLRSSFPLRFRASSLWKTEPVDCPPGSPPFLNAVAIFGVPPSLKAVGLLGQLQALEREFGRSRSGPANAPRTLDLDLIALGSERHSGPGLVLPHPRAHLRAFVLAPLAELEPDWVLPGQQETVAELLARIGSGPPVQRVTAGARQ